MIVLNTAAATPMKCRKVPIAIVKLSKSFKTHGSFAALVHVSMLMMTYGGRIELAEMTMPPGRHTKKHNCPQSTIAEQPIQREHRPIQRAPANQNEWNGAAVRMRVRE